MTDNATTHIEEDSLTKLSMNILIHAGNARDSLVKGLEELETQDYTKAQALLKEAHSEIVTAHGLQTDTLQLEAEGKQIRYSPLFCHAQDTLMTAQSELLIADHLTKILAAFDKGKEEQNA
ncbi:phosphotransferase system enzyme IIA [Lacticaseibacillus paracasei subsp. paracasei Lpp123]|uniref:Phosphotransferase system enzyme IIA n=1 Tax=Lacticaseibacillus paracasei subsp. paracasei Lpp123 TaxID=1256201 RepID=A0A829GKI8_LACPA|nr:phosphotransferase system enzyme IIA [Lacticaseibacillus paracasei subsp. paracasei Lpp123]